MTEPSDEVKRLAEGLTEDEITVVLNHSGRGDRIHRRRFVSLRLLHAQDTAAEKGALVWLSERITTLSPLGKLLAHYLKDKD